MNVWYINSMLGTLRLEEEDDALCGVQLCPDGVPDLEPLPRKVCETPLLQETEEQLNEYFAGARREFDLPLAPKGTAFQKAVWAEMNKIPYGEVRAPTVSWPRPSANQRPPAPWAGPATATPLPSSSPATVWWAPAAASPATPTGWR